MPPCLMSIVAGGVTVVVPFVAGNGVVIGIVVATGMGGPGVFAGKGDGCPPLFTAGA